MKRRSIVRAYQNVRPDEEAKQRMLQNIRLSSEIPPAGKDERKMRRKMKPMVLVAIISLMIFLMGCAIVVLNLQDLKIGELTYTNGEILDSEGNVLKESYVTKDVISLQGIKDTPNQLAAQEWLEFENSYDVDGQLIGDAEAAGYVTPREYDAYFVYDQTMQDKVDEIARKYGLKLAGMQAMVQKNQNEIFFNALGFENLHIENAAVEVEYLSGYFYECGNFNMEFLLTLTGENQWPHEILANMRYNGKEYLDTVFTSIANIEEVEQWNYTTANGTDILIVMGKGFARFFCDREDAFLTSGFGTDYESENGEIRYMTKADVEAVADALHFEIVPQRPDMDTVRKALSEAEQEHDLPKSVNRYASFADCIAHQIAKLEDKATEMYYHQMDLNDDGEDELILGTRDEIETVWMMISGEVNLIVDYGEDYQKLKEAWPNMEKEPIMEYGVATENKDKYGYQRYIDEVLSLEHPENTLFVLSDVNNDGVQELLIGDQNVLSFVWRVKYRENGTQSIELLSWSMAEDELDTLREAWPTMDRKSVTEYYSE